VYFSFGGTIVKFDRFALTAILGLVRNRTARPNKDGTLPLTRGRFSTQSDVDFGKLLASEFFDVQSQLLQSKNQPKYEHNPRLCSFVPRVEGRNSNRLYTSIQGVRVTYLFRLGAADRALLSSFT
jgi:hypothetical protein